MGIWRLAWREFSLKIKTSLLACISVGAAGALLFFAQAERDSVANQTPYFTKQIAGKYSFWITRDSKRSGSPKGMGMKSRLKSNKMPDFSSKKANKEQLARIFEQLQQDPAVKKLTVTDTFQVIVNKSELVRHHPTRAMAISLDDNEPPFNTNILQGRWIDTQSEVSEGVLHSKITVGINREPVRLGMKIRLRFNNIEQDIRVVGLINTSKNIKNYPSVFINKAASTALLKNKANANSAYIELKTDVDSEMFYMRWKEKISKLRYKLHSPYKSTVSEDRRAAASMQTQSFALTLLASIMLVYLTAGTNLSRQRHVTAKLRALGMTRVQNLRFVFYRILIQGFFAIIFSCGIGALAIYAFCQLHIKMYPAGCFITWKSFVFSTACILLGSVVAAVPILWTSFKTNILQELQLRNNDINKAYGGWRIIIVPILLGILPLVCSLNDLSASNRTILYYSLGLPTFLLGLLLICPVVVYWAEKLLFSVVAIVLGLPRSLLRQQLSSRLRISATVVICLSIGLGLFMTIRIWGHSMSVPFYPTKDLPDAVISIKPDGISQNNFNKIYSLSGVMQDHCVAVFSRQQLLSEDTQKKLTNDKRRILRQNTVLVTGMNVTKAFLGDDPIISSTFIDGNATDAVAKMKRGNYCIIPDTFSNHLGLGVGGKIGIENNDGKPVLMEIVGVIKMPWHLLTAWTGMRGLEDNPFPCLSIVFVSQKVSQVFTDSDRARFFWAKLHREFMSQGHAHWGANLTSQIRKITNQNVGVFEGSELYGAAKNHSDDILARYCEFPIFILIITMLAVICYIVASVEDRKWEFGVLYSLGMTSWQMMRILQAEVIIIGCSALFMSLCGSLLLAWSVLKLEGYTFIFSALPLELIVPWDYIGVAVLFTFIGCNIAGAIPAILASRQEPLKLISNVG